MLEIHHSSYRLWDCTWKDSDVTTIRYTCAQHMYVHVSLPIDWGVVNGRMRTLQIWGTHVCIMFPILLLQHSPAISLGFTICGEICGEIFFICDCFFLFQPLR